MILVLGGSGCGKSAYSENRVMEMASPKGETIYYLATMQVYGEEGKKKVERHHALRRGKGMVTIEQPRDIADAVLEMGESPGGILIEDLGNLVANEMFSEDSSRAAEEELVAQKIIRELCGLRACTRNLVVVSNNVFEDGVCYGESTLAYMRVLGKVNAAIAEMADEVVELVVGIPYVLKKNAGEDTVKGAGEN